MGKMIGFDEKRQVFKIDTPNSSYVMGIVGGEYLAHLYYGQRIEVNDLGYLLDFPEEDLINASVGNGERVSFMDRLPHEYPCHGTGDFRQSCLKVRGPQGNWGVDLRYAGYEIVSGKPELDGLPATFGDDGETLAITLRDDCLGLKVKLLYSVFPGIDCVMRSVSVENQGADMLYLEKVLSACLNVGEGDCEALSLTGSWARERHITRQKVDVGVQLIESARGISSHQHHPFYALVSEHAGQESGEVYGMHFVYSGSFQGIVEKSQHGSHRMVMGIHPQDFCWQLKSGESFQAPEVVLVYSGTGLDAMTRNLHELYREHLLPRKWVYQKRPVLINNWEATYFDFDQDKLLAIAKEAAGHGIEMLVMDDGWFGRRDSDNSSLGDWKVNEEKLRGGLKKLVDGVNALGMKFGIWFEPEMISPDSEVYCAHPDWALRLPGREPAQSRNQLVMDLSRPEVREYVYESVAGILRSANISYVKWDMNRPLTDVGSSYLPADRQGELMHRHTLAVYELQGRLCREFPDLLLENCASGGARFDPGMLYYSPQIWCSDDTDAIERLAIQEGTQLLYPLSVIGAHVSDCPNHVLGRSVPFETRAVVAMAGTFGYELDITKISEEERAAIPAQVKRYQAYAPLIQQGDYYRIASYQDNHYYDCYQVVSKDKKTSILMFVQVLAQVNRPSRTIRLKGLAIDRDYRIDGKVYSGEALMKAGLVLKRPHGDFRGEIIEISMFSR